MKKSKNGLTKYLLNKTLMKPILLFTITILTACNGDEVKAIEEIQIAGGHQVERFDTF